MTLEAALRFSPRRGVEVRFIADGAVLVDMNSGDIFELNTIGAEIWTRLAAGATTGDICRELGSRYPVAPVTLDQDVVSLVKSLEHCGLLERIA